MADYYGITRTNYFSVKDPHQFKKIIENAHCTGFDSKIEIWERKDGNKTLYGFGCYGSIEGLLENWEDNNDADYDGDYDFSLFESELSKIVSDDDAIVITEIGHEKLRYFTACSVVITSKGTELVNLDSCSVAAASKMLINPEWKTKMCY